ncbi:MAG: 3-hydroxyacyl-CoA dehydrogenase [Alphaproteobacteria bacterium]|nr:3-hydroxyacyl-CoA dehydrogenase [Alphaproteobacteria bacterium]
MANEIKQVAVIGSGVMGSQIAAHVANAGIPVLLLDIVPKGAEDRSQLAKGAIEKLLKMDPAPFMHKKNARLVTPGNIEDDLPKLKDVDWVVEAVLENPQIKSDLYKKVDAVRKPGSIVSSNTSTIPLEVLIKDQSAAFARDFLITHFFNPPRYLHLLELVVGQKTRDDAISTISAFVDIQLGKGVVRCKDTPGFIANRLGTFFMQTAINATLDLGLSVQEADAVCSRPMGVPKTGVFGLIDLVGLDLMPLIAKSFMGTLPADDEYRKIYREPELFGKMIADGYTGRKGKGGFYRLNREGGKKVKEAIDLKTGQYSEAGKPKIAALQNAGKDLRKLCETDDEHGKLAWAVLGQTLSYAASLAGQIADDIVSIDNAMRWGYNWKFGPFELIDQLGTAWFTERLKKEGRPVPPLLEAAKGRPFYRIEGRACEYLTLQGTYAPVTRPEGVLLLADIKRGAKPVLKNGSASLWDIGDGVACFEIHTKMNSFDPDVLGLVLKSVDLIASDRLRWKGMVVHNEGDNFSAGANLGLALFALNIGLYPAIDSLVEQGQKAFRALRFAPFPSVGAPFNLALGGGCEVNLGCSAVQAHAELYMGLVEVGVGIVPGWGGCAQMLMRAFSSKKRFGGPMPPLAQVFETVGTAKVSRSAAEAKDLMYLRKSDGITMNRDRLLFDAKQKVLALAPGYKPPEEMKFRLPGKAGRAALSLVLQGMRLAGKVTPHDMVVSSALGNVLTGGDTDITAELTEADILALERSEFMKLVKTPGTLARIEHMLGTGKPLRN